MFHMHFGHRIPDVDTVLTGLSQDRSVSRANFSCGSIEKNDMIIIDSAVWHHNFGNYPGDADH